MATLREKAKHKKAVAAHARFLGLRKLGMTRKTTRTAKEILGAKRFQGGTFPDRRRRQLEKAMSD